MDPHTYTAALNAMVAGSMRGMKMAADEINRTEPGAVPPLDDAVMFDVGVMLLATLIEANPDYRDSKRFGKAADMVRSQVMDSLRWVRQFSDAEGTKLLYKAVRAATGTAPIANDFV